MKFSMRGWTAIWRDTIILFREFQTPLALFTVTVLIGAFAYISIASQVGEPVEGYTEAVYISLTSAFMQFGGDFPKNIYLQLFHIFMPIVGISALALGLADFCSRRLRRRMNRKS